MSKYNNDAKWATVNFFRITNYKFRTWNFYFMPERVTYQVLFIVWQIWEIICCWVIWKLVILWKNTSGEQFHEKFLFCISLDFIPGSKYIYIKYDQYKYWFITDLLGVKTISSYVTMSKVVHEHAWWVHKMLCGANGSILVCQ